MAGQASAPPGELSFSCGMDMLKGVIIVGRQQGDT